MNKLRFKLEFSPTARPLARCAMPTAWPLARCAMPTAWPLARCAMPTAWPLALCAMFVCLGMTATGTTLRAADEFTTGSSDAVISEVNRLIRQGWEDNEISPSEVATDAEWLRRVYLDIVGHIPPANEVEKFLADRDKTKRAKMIEMLLDHEDYVPNWTTVWTNLLIGRQTPDKTSRFGMQKFLREAFSRNRPWNDVVSDIIAAEGHFEQNGAVNYLLGQMTMQDEGVQATAKTTRVFMGIQVQCTQCHNHPFNDWQQSQFWEFNSFFRQARRMDYEKYDPDSGQMVDDYSELVFQRFDGPVYFEKRSGLMQVAYPKYFGEKIDIENGTDRRKVLGEIVAKDEGRYIARAMVNRMWGHFFGYGFTKPVDDMGPHNPPSHPRVLELLTDEFVKSNYDLKQLMRWIANTEAYNLTSQFGRDNEIDNPAAGEMPLFSHMYMKSMQAEQLYDSLLVATKADESGGMSYDQRERNRNMWLQQFVIAFGTDENDEATTFDGTISQALMMMNGPLVDQAISAERGSYLNTVLTRYDSDSERIRQLFMASLGRLPKRSEMSTSLSLIRSNRNQFAAYQDLFWALLNSNEFIFVH